MIARESGISFQTVFEKASAQRKKFSKEGVV
jgi:hypothetical protein